MAILKIANQPRTYAWGSLELIPDLLGIAPNGKPQAEIWLGTHPGSLAQVVDDESGTLRDRVGELGFLVKILAAGKPLSIQAHPTKEHAAKRFAEGYPGYTDPNHKPELIAAISEFRALCGFRPIGEISADLDTLAQSSDVFQPWLAAFAAEGIAGATSWALAQSAETVSELGRVSKILAPARAGLIQDLLAQAGEDVGVLVSLLMNYVVLQPGEALFLPAGNIHAYLSGLGVEVMAASDNVLRGGLTAKPVDIPELLTVLDFSELAEPRAQAKELVRGLTKYSVSVDDFQVYRVEPSGSNLLIDLNLRGRAILVCISGEITLSTSREDSMTLRRGEACYFDAANYFSVLGAGTGYLAMG